MGRTKARGRDDWEIVSRKVVRSCFLHFFDQHTNGFGLLASYRSSGKVILAGNMKKR